MTAMDTASDDGSATLFSQSQQEAETTIHVTMKKSNTTSRSSCPSRRRRRHRGPLAFGMCLLLSTTVLLCNMNLLKNAYKPPTRRTTHVLPLQANHSIVHNNTMIPPPKAQQQPKKKGHQRRKLDFLIAGFPKCGTTTLMHAFAAHNETDISTKEKCQIGGSNLAAGPAYAKLTEVVSELSTDANVKRGVKCPISLRSHRTISLLVRHSPETRLIIGVRHPVRMLESHYNYRITELYDKKKQANIPPIETLVNGNEWMGVSTRNARFEIPLMQLGKTNMTTRELEKLGLMAHAAVVPNKFKVFLYSLEQLKDKNATRTDNVRHSLESFLELEHPMKPLGHENLNRFVGENAHKETIDICDDKYADLRIELITKGRETQLWLRYQFLKSPDVTVANRNHFLELLQEWESDPCVKSNPPAAAATES